MEIYNRMRGFTPWPGAYTEFRGQTCHVWGKPCVARVNHQRGVSQSKRRERYGWKRGRLLSGMRSGNRNGANARQTRRTKTDCGWQNSQMERVYRQENGSGEVNLQKITCSGILAH